MTEQEVNNIIDRKLSSFQNGVVTQHRHNGSDAPQIPSVNLLPYPIDSVNTPLGDNLPNGAQRLFDYSDNPENPSLSLWSWGYNVRLGNIPDVLLGPVWRTTNIADFYLSANQSTPQIFMSGTFGPVIYDTLNTSYPATYDTATGKFSAPVNPRDTGSTLAFESWYLVTASVDITPGNRDEGTISISIEIDGSTVATNVFPVNNSSSGDTYPFTATISYLSETPITDYIAIVLTNQTNGDSTTTGGYFKVKQLTGNAI